MKVSLEEKKAEAVARMEMLGIFPETIRQFEKDGLVSVSEPPFGAFFWVDEEDKKLIAEFEKSRSALVYMIVRSYFKDWGKVDAYLFVSDYKDEEWDLDRNDLKHGQALAYVYNHDEPVFSEIGTVGLQLTVAAGLQRIW